MTPTNRQLMCSLAHMVAGSTDVDLSQAQGCVSEQRAPARCRRRIEPSGRVRDPEVTSRPSRAASASRSSVATYNQALLRASVTSAIKDVLVLRRAIILRMKAGPKPSY
jgi:hypothetical protein